MNIIDQAKLQLHPLFKHANPVEPTEGYKHGFEIKPEDAYPAAVEDILKTIKTNEGWTEDIGLNSKVAIMPRGDWDLINVPAENVRSENVLARAAALHLARLWFTEKLHAFVKHESMNIKIARQPQYKMFPSWYKPDA